MTPLSTPTKKVVAFSPSIGKATSGATNGFLASGVASCFSTSESCGGLRISVFSIKLACLLRLNVDGGLRLQRRGRNEHHPQRLRLEGLQVEAIVKVHSRRQTFHRLLEREVGELNVNDFRRLV